MKRLFALVVAAMASCGCQSQSPPSTDPFFGPTTVPPPATGAISGPLADPYYRAAPYPVRPGYPAPPLSPTPNPSYGTGGQSPPPGGNYQHTPPNGNYRYQGSSTQGTVSPLHDSSKRLEDGPMPVDETVAKLARREPVIQILPPRSEPAASPSGGGGRRSTITATAREPRWLDASGGAIDIMDLPKADTSTFSPGAQAASDTGGFRLVSAVDEPDDSAVVTADMVSSVAVTKRSSRSKHGYDPQYRWLRGTLEYSQIDCQWKLRYIPIDAATDKFGGSVVLSDPTLLAGLERGDLVEVRGRLGSLTPKKGYAPKYDLTEIKRLIR